jgi:SnoaL-like protein
VAGGANAEAAERLFAAWQDWDLDTIGSLYAEDAVDRRPQSGERFVGRTNIMGMYREVPGPPRITWRSIRGGPEVWAAQGVVDYGEGPVPIVGIVELADGAVVEADFYFAEPFDPPEARARWAGPSLT